MICSLVIGTGTIFFEALLMIYRMVKLDQAKEVKKTKAELQRAKMELEIIKDI